MRMRVNRSLVHFLAMATAVVYLSASTGVLAAQRSAISNIRIKNFGCINEDFYRGAQPSEKDYASLASVRRCQFPPCHKRPGTHCCVRGFLGSFSSRIAA